MIKKRTKTLKVPIRKGYPAKLTLGQTGKYKDFMAFYNERKAIAYSKLHGGQMYTQVEDESYYNPRCRLTCQAIAYLRGHHIVNRTGHYIVVRKRK